MGILCLEGFDGVVVPVVVRDGSVVAGGGAVVTQRWLVVARVVVGDGGNQKGRRG